MTTTTNDLLANLAGDLQHASRVTIGRGDEDARLAHLGGGTIPATWRDMIAGHDMRRDLTTGRKVQRRRRPGQRRRDDWCHVDQAHVDYGTDVVLKGDEAVAWLTGRLALRDQLRAGRVIVDPADGGDYRTPDRVRADDVDEEHRDLLAAYESGALPEPVDPAAPVDDDEYAGWRDGTIELTPPTPPRARRTVRTVRPRQAVKATRTPGRAQAVEDYLDRLIHPPKRTYAAAYAAYLAGGGPKPADPGTPWAVKVRAKLERISR